MEYEECEMLRSRLQDFREDGDYYTGYVSHADDLKELDRTLLTIGVSFKTESSHYHKDHNEEDNRKIMFSSHRGAVPVACDVPFRVISFVEKGCIYGKGRRGISRTKLTGPATERTEEAFKKRRTKSSRKRGCTATMYFKHVQLFPQFKIVAPAGSSKTRVKALKSEQLELLADQLSSGRTLLTEDRFYIKMSKMCCHTGHNFPGTAACTQTLRPSVSDRIEELGEEGTTSVPGLTLNLSDPSHVAELPEAVCHITVETEPFHIETEELPQRTRRELQREIRDDAEQVKLLAAYCVDEDKLEEAGVLMRKAQQLLIQGAVSGITATKGVSGQAERG